MEKRKRIFLIIAIISFFFKNQLDYPRLMMVYVWALTIIFTTLGRAIQSRVQLRLQARHWGEERVLIVGAGEIGRVVMQKIKRTPGLGYRVVGFVDDETKAKAVQDCPVQGKTDNVPELIKALNVNEVIIAMPDATHQEILRVASQCDRGRVTVEHNRSHGDLLAGSRRLKIQVLDRARPSPAPHGCGPITDPSCPYASAVA